MHKQMATAIKNDLGKKARPPKRRAGRETAGCGFAQVPHARCLLRWRPPPLRAPLVPGRPPLPYTPTGRFTQLRTMHARGLCRCSRRGNAGGGAIAVEPSNRSAHWGQTGRL